MARPMSVASRLTGLVIVIVTLLLPGVEPGKFKCPSFTKLTSDPFVYQDPDQCDKYWTCVKGESKRSLCPDGLVFHPGKEDGEDPCDQKQNVPDKCEGRPKLQRPKPGDGHCPRQNGVYPSADPFECDTYYSCLNGKASPTKCVQGLHYSDVIGTCVWPRESGREDCASDDEESGGRRKKPKSMKGPDATTRKPAEALSNGFKCPGGPIGVHPALPHPTDCRLYYVCLDGLTPSDAGCTKGKVFNPTTQQCDSPGNVEGCEFYYNPAAKKKKEEQKQSIASEIGADISSNDSSQFIKLLKMTGVLGGNSVNDAFQTGLGGNGFKQGGRIGGGRRKRPKNRRNRPVRPRPSRPQYDDYFYYQDYEYDIPEARPKLSLHASSPANRPFNQRPRVGGNDREPDFPSIQNDDLKDIVRATPIQTTQQETSSKSIEHILTPTSSQGLFSVPKSRKNIFTSRFIPKVKSVGNLANIHPTGFSQSARGTVTDRAVKSPVQPAKAAVVPQLSGKDAENLFNSLFPTLIGDSSEPLPAPQPLVAPEPILPTTTTIREKHEESPRRPVSVSSSPLSRPRSRTTLFKRRPFKTETTTNAAIEEKTLKVETIEEVTTEESSATLRRVGSSGRQSLFSTRNKLRTRPNILENTEEVPTTNPPEKVALKEEPLEEIVEKPKPNILTSLRKRHRFSFAPKLAPVDQDVTEDNFISTDKIEEENFTTAKTFTNQSPRKSFRSLLKSRSQNRLAVSAPKIVKKNERPSSTSSSLLEPIHLPKRVPELVTESHQLLVDRIPISPTHRPQRVQVEMNKDTPIIAQKTRRILPAFIDPAFLHSNPLLPAAVTTSPVTQFEKSASQRSRVIASPLQDSVRSLSRARGRPDTIGGQDQLVRAEPSLQSDRFPKGRSSDVSEPFDNVADREQQRIIAHKVRTQLKDYLPEAENEGDAIEKLRAKIERNQNRNRARG